MVVVPYGPTEGVVFGGWYLPLALFGAVAPTIPVFRGKANPSTGVVVLVHNFVLGGRVLTKITFIYMVLGGPNVVIRQIGRASCRERV